MEEIRQHGRKVLGSILRKENRNAEILEKYIYEMATQSNYSYNDILYECIGELQTLTEIHVSTLRDLLHRLHSGTIMWDNPVYFEISKQIHEEEQFITAPFEIVEGVLECKCGSKRTISFQRQTRSADEGSTTFAQCIECGTRWRHNN